MAIPFAYGAAGVPPFPADQCPADRYGTKLNCTANDVVFAGNPTAGQDTSCVAGGPPIVLPTLNVKINAGSSSRYNIGLFVGNDGKNIQLLSPLRGGLGDTTCSTYVLPTTPNPPWQNLDGNVCGDVNYITKETNDTIKNQAAFSEVKLACVPGANGYLLAPMLISWQQGPAVCTGNTYPVTGTTSKCNASSGTVVANVLVKAKLTIKKAAAGGSAVSFPFTATATSGGSSATPTDANGASKSSFSLLGGPVAGDTQTLVIPFGGSTPTASIAVTEGPLPTNWNLQGISCVDDVTGKAASFVAIDAINKKLTANFNATNLAATCTFTNSTTTSATVTKEALKTGALTPVSTFPQGGTGVFRITVKNTTGSNINKNSFILADTLPAGLTPTSATPADVVGNTGVTCSLNSQTVSCVNGNAFNIGDSFKVDIAVTVSASAAGTYLNTANFTANAQTVTSSAAVDVFGPPTLDKSFSPSAILSGKASTLTINLNNNNTSALTLTGDLKDTLPAGVSFTTTPATVGGTCVSGYYGTLTTQTGSPSSLTYTSGSLIPSGGCSITVDVTASTSGTYTNTIAGGALTTNAGSNANGASATLTVASLSPPSISKSFSPSSLGLDGTGTLTVTLGNPNTSPAYPLMLTVDLEDLLPNGLQVAANPNVRGSCDSSYVMVARGTPTLGGLVGYASGGVIPAGGCTILVDVTSATAGDYPNQIAAGSLQTTGGNGGATAATLLVLAPPTLAKSFSPASIPAGAKSRLTLSLGNSNSTALTLSAALTDSLPDGVVLSAAPNIGGTCTAANVNAVAGKGTLTYTSGATIPANGCTIEVDVTSSVQGVYTNTIPAGGLETVVAGSNATAATASLTVIAHPSVTKEFFPDPIATGATSTLEIALGNDNPSDLTLSANLVDSLPASVMVANPVVTSGSTCDTSKILAPAGGGTITYQQGAIIPSGGCLIHVIVTSNQVGTHTNTIAAGDLQTVEGGNNPLAATADLVVQANAPPSLTKSFTPATLSLGGTSTLTLTLANTNAGPLTLTAALVDNLSGAKLSIATPPNAATTCSGGGVSTTASSVTLAAGAVIPASGSCTLSVNVTATEGGTHTNTIPVGGLQTNGGNNPYPAEATLTVLAADLAVTKTDGKASVDAGGTGTYTIVVTNNGPSEVTGATVEDTAPTGLTLGTWTCAVTIAGSGTGTTTCGAASGSGDLDTTVSLKNGGKITFTVPYTVAADATGSLTNTVSVAPPAGTPDPTPGNNSATDTDTVNLKADLAVTKDDGKASVDAGGIGTYTIVVTNNGPSEVTNATVKDTAPAGLTLGTWTCALTTVAGSGACGAASGSGTLDTTVSLKKGGVITFTVPYTVANDATDPLANTVSVAPPSGTTDSTSGNNSATDTDTVNLKADLAVTKTDGEGVDAVDAGGTGTYTIVVTNNGPSAVTGAKVVDKAPTGLTLGAWTCTLTTPGSGGTGTTACGAASGTGDLDTTVNLKNGGKITYSVAYTVANDATGSLVNTVSVAPPTGTTDPTLGNNSATDTDTVNLMADLAVTKDDGKTSVDAGGTGTYTIVVTNNGPSEVTNATVKDTAPAGLTLGTWQCAVTTAGSGGSVISACGAATGSGNLDTKVTLKKGGVITYTVPYTVANDATGDKDGLLINTVTVAPPTGTSDPIDPKPDNNTATDTDKVNLKADLAVTKTDGKSSVDAGGTGTYTIVVTNNGPSEVTGATLVDTVPTGLTLGTWTCAVTTAGSGGSVTTACGPASPPGTLNTTVSLKKGGVITYTVPYTVADDATGSLTNTVSVAPPSGTTDPTSGNDSATDTDTVNPKADLAVTKDDGKTSVDAGGTGTYTILVTNNGPSEVTGATVVDTVPTGLTLGTWTCAVTTAGSGGSVTTACGPASPTGTLNTTVSLKKGGVITYTVPYTVADDATGSLTNTVSVAPPSGTTDPTSGNDSATDTDTVNLRADLAVTKDDTKTSVDAGGTGSYTIVVTNKGPSEVTGGTVVDTVPTGLTLGTWTCAVTTAGSGGSVTTACGAASGSGTLNTTLSLKKGGVITYTVPYTVANDATGSLANSVSVAPPAGTTDPTSDNNSATDTDTVNLKADLAVTKDDGKTSVDAGGTGTYTIVVTNNGPSEVTNATVKDTAPAGLTLGTWTCAVTTAGSGGSVTTACGAATGSGNLDTTVTLKKGGVITYTAPYTVAKDATGDGDGLLINTVTVAPPAGTTDPTDPKLDNNSATDKDKVNLKADLAVTKTDGLASVSAGGSTTYTLTLTNNGPSAANGATLQDAATTGLIKIDTPTCMPSGGAECPSSLTNAALEAGVSIPTLPSGGSLTIRVKAKVLSNATGSLANTAMVNPPTGTTDPSTDNNSATDTDQVNRGMIGDLVWYDSNHDGIQDPAEPGLAGVKVDLYAGDGTTKLAETWSDGSGHYQFAGLADGTYLIHFFAPANYLPSPVNKGSGPLQDSFDSDPSQVDGRVSVTLSGGGANPTIDAGFYLDLVNPASIGDRVWYDTNKDGVQDAGEPGQGGVTVSLLDADHGNALLATRISDANGFYKFDGLAAGTYVLQFTPPSGYERSQKDQGGDDIKDSDADPSTGRTPTIPLSAGQRRTDVDAGLYLATSNLGSIGDRVWYDDGNGIQDGGEPGIPGLRVNLYDSTGTSLLQTTRTDPSGAYRFIGLNAGTYVIEFIRPNANYVFSPAGQASDPTKDSDPDPATGLANLTLTESAGKVVDTIAIDAGLYVTSKFPIGLGDFVWLDANGDGKQDGESALSGVQVVLYDSLGNPLARLTTTSDAANYGFTGLAADGSYRVAIDTDTLGGRIQTYDLDLTLDHRTDLISPATSTSPTNADFGYLVPSTGISIVKTWADDAVVQDDGDGTFSQLISNPGTAKFKITVTNTGNLTLKNVTLIDAIAGDCEVKWRELAGSDTLAPSEIKSITCQKSSVNGSVENPDANYTNLAKVEGQPVDLSGNPVGSTISAEGKTDVVVIHPAIAITKKLMNDKGVVVIGDGATSGTATFEITVTNTGDVALTNVSISDSLAPDCAKTETDIGALASLASKAYITYTCTKAVNAPLVNTATVTGTPPVGSDVSNSAYAEVPVATAGLAITKSTTTPIVRKGAKVEFTIKVTNTGTAALTGVTVSDDLTKNCNKKDTTAIDLAPKGEAGDYSEYKCSTDEGVTESFTNIAVASHAVTGPVSGVAQVTVINPSLKIVKVANDDYPNPNPTLRVGTLVSFNYMVTNNGDAPLDNVIVSDNKLDPVHCPKTKLAAGEAMTCFGYAQAIWGDYQNTGTVSATAPDKSVITASDTSDYKGIDPAVIGNYVWLDENGDGVQDAGEPGIPNLTVNLYRSIGVGNDGVAGNDDDYQFVVFTITDALGGYLFTNVDPGQYKVKVIVAPVDGLYPTYDEDDKNSSPNGETLVTVGHGLVYLTADFGFNWVPAAARTNPGADTTGAIGDRVWIDANGDGIQDPGEPGLAGVTLTLTGPGDDGIFGTGDDTLVKTTKTDASGNYIFTGLPSGAYRIRVDETTLPTGTGLTWTQTGDPDGAGSADSMTTTPILLAPGDVFVNADFGYQPSQGSRIGDTIYYDVEADQVQGVNDPGIAGVTVALLRDDGDNNTIDPVIATTITDATGHYLFTGLPAGNYTVVVTDTDNVLGRFQQSADPAIHGNPQNPPAGYYNNKSSLSDVDGRSDYRNIDFGYTALGEHQNFDEDDGTIGDTIFLDRNDNNKFDPGEGLQGVTVDLYAILNGMPATFLATTTTNANGTYNFGRLSINANYFIQVVTATLPNKGDGLFNFADPDNSVGVGNSNATVPVLSGTGGINMAQDFGYQASSPAKIGGTLWNDANGNGTLDGTETERLGGITLVLLDTKGNLVAKTTTDTNGDYSFSGLPAGTYRVHVTDTANVLEGWWHSLDPNGQGQDGYSQSDPYEVIVAANDYNFTADFGYYHQGAALGNRVWRDVNRDGLQDSGETGLAGATVELVLTYPSAGTPTTLKTISGSDGGYRFGNLLLDERFIGGEGDGQPTYQISVATPPGYTPNPVGVGSNRRIDSGIPAGTKVIVTRGQLATAVLNDPASEPDNASYDFGFEPQIDLSLTKTVSPDPQKVDELVSFDLTLSNAAGSSDASGVKVTDWLPDGYTFVSASPAVGSYDSTTGVWTVGNLAAGGSVTLTITARVNASGDYTNVAEVTAADQVDSDSTPNNGPHAPQEEDDRASVEPTISPQIDLSLSKAVSTSTPKVGDMVTFTLTLNNAAGFSLATEVEVTDFVPTGYSVSNEISEISDGGSASGNTVTWSGLTLDANTNKSLTFKALVLPTGDYENTAEITKAKEADKDSKPNNRAEEPGEDDTASVATTPQAQIDLSLVKSVSPDKPSVGETVTFTLTLSNEGGYAPATGVKVQDFLPAGYGDVSEISVPGSLSGNTLTWSDLTLNANSNLSLTFKAVVKGSGSHTNVAEVMAAVQPDKDSTPGNGPTNTPEDDRAILTPDIAPRIDLGLIKAVDPESAKVGETVTFTLTAKNAAGFSNATGVAVTDRLPGGYRFLSATASQGSYDPDKGVWTLGDLAAGNSKTLTIKARVLASGEYENVAVVTTPDQIDFNEQDNTDKAKPTITPTADLAVQKNGPVLVAANGTIIYTVTVANAGPSAADGAKFSDANPTGLTDMEWTCGNALGEAVCPDKQYLVVGDIAAGVVIPKLPAGGSLVFTLTGKAPDGTNPADLPVHNLAKVKAPDGVFDPDSSNNEDSVDTRLGNTPDTADLAILKYGPASVTAGSTLTYRLVVTNAGYAAADGAVLQDPAVTDLTKTGTPTCEAFGGAQCPDPEDLTNAALESETGLEIPFLPSGASLSLTLSALVNADSGSMLENLASIDPPEGVDDPDPDNNLSSAETEVVGQEDITRHADLALVKSGPASVAGGGNVTYQLLVSNGGPDDADGTRVSDSAPAVLTHVSWYCDSAKARGGALCPSGTDDPNTPVTGNINTELATFPADSSLTLIMSGSAPAAGAFVNSARVIPPLDLADPDPSNNPGGPVITQIATLTLSGVVFNDNGAGGGSARNGVQDGKESGVDPGVDPGDLKVVVLDEDGKVLAVAGVKGDGIWSAVVPAGTGYTVYLTTDPSLKVGASVISPTAQVPDGWATTNENLGGKVDTTGDGLLGDIDSSTDLVLNFGIRQTHADLAVTKTDKVDAVDAGGNGTYTIVVTNKGPSEVTGATIKDIAPKGLTLGHWDCKVTEVGTGGIVTTACGLSSGEGDLQTTADLSMGGEVTYTLAYTAADDAKGTLTNTVTVDPPADLTDPNLGDNTATDTDTVNLKADLAVTKTDGKTSVDAGGSGDYTSYYTIVVTNNGPSEVSGARIRESVPAGLTLGDWTCALTSAAGSGACGADTGTGNLDTRVSLKKGGEITYTVHYKVADEATSPLTNTVSVELPAGTTDPKPDNDSAFDTDTVNPIADLAITKDDNKAMVYAGGSGTYIIMVTNNGPSEVTGARVVDKAPAGLTLGTWNCAVTSLGSGSSGTTACSAATGSGTLDTTVSLKKGGVITYTLPYAVADVSGSELVNQATVTPPAGVVDPEQDNDSATDTDAINRDADLIVNKNGPAAVSAGDTVRYTVRLYNAGPAAAHGATLTDAVPSGVTNLNWSCGEENGGAACPASIDPNPPTDGKLTIPTLPAGGALTFTLIGTAPVSGIFVNTTTASPPDGFTDPHPNNNDDLVTSQVARVPTTADLAVVKYGPASVESSGPLAYTVVVTNAGPGAADGAKFSDALPSGASTMKWTRCAATGGAVCPSFGSPPLPPSPYQPVFGPMSNVVIPTLPAGGSLAFTVLVQPSGSWSSSVSNTASILPPTGVTDPIPGNDNDTTTASVATQTASADLAMAKTGPATVIKGGTLTYTLVLSNAGPDSAHGAMVRDLVSEVLTEVSWSCGDETGEAKCPASIDPNPPTGGRLTIPTLPAGSSVTISVTGKAPDSGAFVNSAEAIPPVGVGDPNPTNNVGGPVITQIDAPVLLDKTLYGGHNSGDSCDDSSKATDTLFIVTPDQSDQTVTWCFKVANASSQHLSSPVLEDIPLAFNPPKVTLPTVVGESVSVGSSRSIVLKRGSFPLAPGQSAVWYLEETRNTGLLNSATITLQPTDALGKETGDPPAKATDNAANFAYVFDPPYGVKTGKQTSGQAIVNWNMVWINDATIPMEGVVITDPLPDGMTFLGNLTCTGEGNTTVKTPVADNCIHQPGVGGPKGQVYVVANFAADPGGTLTTAKHRLVISFDVTVDDPNVANSYQNQAKASWTPEGGPELTAVTDNDTLGGEEPSLVDFKPPVSIPTLSEWANLLLTLMMMGMAWRFRSRLVRQW